MNWMQRLFLDIDFDPPNDAFKPIFGRIILVNLFIFSDFLRSDPNQQSAVFIGGMFDEFFSEFLLIYF
jgi:hypothetical protein